jgi:gelsolin
VWRVNDKDKALLSSSDQSKFYTGDCYIFQYTYPGDDKEECLIGTWFGKKSVEEDRITAVSLASKMVESAKFQAVQARLYEGKEPIQFFVIFQSLLVFKGGLSSGYKKFIAENGIDDDSYSEEGLALFQIQGSGPENMQAIQVDPVSNSAFLFPKVYLTAVNIITSSLPVIYYLRSLFLGGLIIEFILLLHSP